VTPNKFGVSKAGKVSRPEKRQHTLDRRRDPIMKETAAKANKINLKTWFLKEPAATDHLLMLTHRFGSVVIDRQVRVVVPAAVGMGWPGALLP